MFIKIDEEKIYMQYINKYLINIKIELPLFTHFNFSLLQKKLFIIFVQIVTL